jgi:glucuronate isomerase
MAKFMDENFLLESNIAQDLFHNYAKEQPIFDFHNHLSVKEIYEDTMFENITQVWLDTDHYKWRAMRAFGIDEEYITGDKPDYEKFKKWAELMPYLIGNPLYHWNHLELQRYFGISEPLSSDTCDMIWEKCNTLLKTAEFSVRNLLRKMKVKVLCTTDDPKDSLSYHKKLKDEFEIKVLPTYRPDKYMNIKQTGFISYLEELELVVGYKIQSASDLKKALIERIHYFAQSGGVVSDHAMDEFHYLACEDSDVEKIFDKALNNKEITEEESVKFTSNIFVELGKTYSEIGWVMQIHLGALRNNSTRMYEKLGDATGFDSISDNCFAKDLSNFMDVLDYQSKLPKVVLYNLNPRDNEVLATMAGNFQNGNCPGKIQFGSGWWFCDQKNGMERQLEALSQLGLISNFIGMLTDSRSFLSFSRHEYFRRILCNKLGNLIDNGEYPMDMKFVGKIIEDISYNNACRYFGIE